MDRKERIKALVKGKKIILFGPPGSGKGARSEELKDLGLIHVASGIALRTKVRDDSDSVLTHRALSFMKRGALVPDDIVVPIILEYLQKPQCIENGYVLDGFPRTKTQCDILLSKTNIDLVLYLDVPRDFLFFGVIGCNRLSCVSCGSGYSDFDPPKNARVCDNCGENLEKRVDDTAATIENRLKLYEEQTMSFFPDLEKKGIVKRLPITVKNEEEIEDKYLKKLGGEVYWTKDNGVNVRMLNKEGMKRQLYAVLEEYFQ